jgi:hypothetical protein
MSFALTPAAHVVDTLARGSSAAGGVNIATLSAISPATLARGLTRSRLRAPRETAQSIELLLRLGCFSGTRKSQPNQ